MAADLFERPDTEPRDSGRSPWMEISGIVIMLVVVMAALIIANIAFS